MQKFTIFTIIFSVLIITVTAELVVQDYLQKLYPNPSSLQSNSLNASNFNDFVNTSDQANIKSRVEELLEDEDIEIPDDVKPTAESIREDEDTLPDDLETSEFVAVRIQTLLPALKIDQVEYSETTYLGTLFQLINTKDMPIDRATYGLFSVKNVIIGSVYEYRAKSELDAEKIYAQIKSKASDFPEISVNETNQFAERSFYINHIVKVGEVFLVFQQDNYVYAFAYKKDLHDKFVNFFRTLL